jgi:peptidoglycan hydrolase-like protein with peptidoglycan-binding domain
VRFAQMTGVEAPLGNKKLSEVPELAAFSSGVVVISRRDGVRQLGVGSVQDALNVIAADVERRTGQPSLFRVNLGQNNANRGLFGPGTEGAIKRFQQTEGLAQSGRVDNATLSALDRALTTARGTSTPTPAPTPTPTPTPTPPAGAGPGAPRFSAGIFADVAAGRVVMRPGERGPAVVALQQALLDMGFPMMMLKNDVGVSGVDGAWGGQTSTALTNFQVHAKKKFPDVQVNGVLDKATMKALLALSPAPGTKAWESGNPEHGPAPFWNGEASKQLRVVVAKDEHRTFLYGPSGHLEAIFPNAHGSAGNATQSGLKRVRTRLDERAAQATGVQLWQDPRAFGRRIVDLSWASGTSSGEELHGTFDYRGMGKDVSHGCVRHYNEDIVVIFDNLQVGDLVAIVDGVDDPMLRRP